MILRIYPLAYSRYVFKLLYLHFGFDDRCLLWIVGGKVKDILFIKIA
jgi:hypothetical protein